MRTPDHPRHDLTRRAFLGASAAAAAGSLIQAQAPAQGPAVWLDMDQAALDAAYDQNVWAPNRSQILGRFATNSELTRARLGSPRRVAYGPSELEQIDIFVAEAASAPIHVYVHGGAWREGLARSYAFLAESLVDAGAHVAILDFVSVAGTGGDLRPMAAQVRRAVAWLYENATTFDGDPDRLFLSGHSSGAHLAGVALTTDWAGEFGVPADVIKGGLLISGLFDLAPVALSARREYVALSDPVVEALSPQRHLEHLTAPLIVAYGTLESPEFQRQSRDFAAAVAAAGRPVELVVGEGYNHFELVETLANPYGLMGQAALTQMGFS